MLGKAGTQRNTHTVVEHDAKYLPIKGLEKVTDQVKREMMPHIMEKINPASQRIGRVERNRS